MLVRAKIGIVYSIWIYVNKIDRIVKINISKNIKLAERV